MDHWSILLAYSAYPVILAALAPRIRFSLHKEFRDGEIRLYLHKEFRAAELGGDASENGDFHKEKQRLQGTIVFRGRPSRKSLFSIYLESFISTLSSGSSLINLDGKL